MRQLYVENTGFEPVTFPKAFGTLYPTELINQSIYFLLFFFLISFSLRKASALVSNSSVYLIIHGKPFLVEIFLPLLCCFILIDKSSQQPV